MRQYSTKGPGGVGTIVPPFSNYVNQYSLNGSSAVTVTWPAGATHCSIVCNGPYWVRVGAAAVVPAAGIVDGTGSAMNTGPRARGDEQTFSIISNIAQYVTVEFWGN